MALVRIVVDGEGLLQSWTSLAPGKPRQSTVAREELINRLTQYYDACGTPITVIFDALGVSAEVLPPSTPEVEILYARVGQPVPQAVDRLVRKLQSYGDVLAVIPAEIPSAKTGAAADNKAVPCPQFVATVEEALQDLERNISSYNQKERSLFNRTH